MLLRFKLQLFSPNSSRPDRIFHSICSSRYYSSLTSTPKRRTAISISDSIEWNNEDNKLTATKYFVNEVRYVRRRKTATDTFPLSCALALLLSPFSSEHAVCAAFFVATQMGVFVLAASGNSRMCIALTFIGV